MYRKLYISVSNIFFIRYILIIFYIISAIFIGKKEEIKQKLSELIGYYHDQRD